MHNSYISTSLPGTTNIYSIKFNHIWMLCRGANALKNYTVQMCPTVMVMGIISLLSIHSSLIFWLIC
ncbi:hypothetical protein EUGRSUZ_H03107 [Eucalyptus grandis]|uniref:Uncharacterized protein n=2 Tax=Eucalyptus grandis TaxID=71139 RepID=A0ACC3JTL7_EUCGR|nr:hypothetical protein EUGRSUZ_H03107 [Eucalyptus grandis]